MSTAPPDRRLPGRARIAAAIPAGSRRLRGRRIERSYLDALTAWEPLTELRGDARDNVLGVAKQLARRASYEDGTTRRGAAPWSALAGVSASTWKRVRRLLEAWGFLACVVAGTTAAFGPMALAQDVPNTAAVYVLCVPAAKPAASAPPLTGPPTASARTLVQRPARAREENPGNPGGAGCAGAHHEAAAQPAAGAAAGVMRKAAGQTISDGWCAWIWRPFAAAGWTARDLLYAIDHPPGDTGQHRLSAAIRHPVGWLRHRLGLWLEPDGTAKPSLGAVRRAHRERRQADAAAFRAAEAAAAAAATDPTSHAAAIRKAMGWPDPRSEHPDRSGK